MQMKNALFKILISTLIAMLNCSNGLAQTNAEAFEKTIRLATLNSDKAKEQYLATLYASLGIQYDLAVVPAIYIGNNAAMAIGDKLIAIAQEVHDFKPCEIVFFIMHEKTHLDKKHPAEIEAFSAGLYLNEDFLTEKQKNVASKKLLAEMHRQEYEADAGAKKSMEQIYGVNKTVQCLKGLFTQSVTTDKYHPAISARRKALKID